MIVIITIWYSGVREISERNSPKAHWDSQAPPIKDIAEIDSMVERMERYTKENGVTVDGVLIEALDSLLRNCASDGTQVQGFTGGHRNERFFCGFVSPDGPPFTPAASAGGCLWVESHSDAFVTGSWACGAVKTANCLRTYLPAVFAVQQSHALLPVKRGRG
jgi:hypothetical protein